MCREGSMSCKDFWLSRQKGHLGDRREPLIPWQTLLRDGFPPVWVPVQLDLNLAFVGSSEPKCNYICFMFAFKLLRAVRGLPSKLFVVLSRRHSFLVFLSWRCCEMLFGLLCGYLFIGTCPYGLLSIKL